MADVERTKLLGNRANTRFEQQLGYSTFEEHEAYERSKKAHAENQFGDTFLRKTIKYWVLPSNILAVKRRVLNHIPEWTFDNKPTPNIENSGSTSNSVYFDTSDFAMYDKRILQKDKSMLFRYRWYSNNKCKNGFMEQKVRNPRWRGEPSVKQRFSLNPYLVKKFIKQGVSAIPKDVRNLDFVHSMHKDLKEWNASVHHALRTTYRRTVFQEHNGSEVRMSFDEDVTLTDVKHLTWDEAIDPSVKVPEYKVFHFPLGILEVKLAFEKFDEIDLLEIPDWIVAMQNSGLIIEVEKFSKYCTGAAIMNLNRITRVPSWIAAVKTLMEIELARKGREWFGAEKLPKWVIEANVKVPDRVEPREFMANERTLLKWVRMCFLALFVGLALLGFEYEPITGVLLTIFSLMILFRSYYMYRVRLKMLLARSFDVPFHDPYGPHMIVVLFVVPTLTYLAYTLGLWNIKL